MTIKYITHLQFELPVLLTGFLLEDIALLSIDNVMIAQCRDLNRDWVERTTNRGVCNTKWEEISEMCVCFGEDILRGSKRCRELDHILYTDGLYFAFALIQETFQIRIFEHGIIITWKALLWESDSLDARPRKSTRLSLDNAIALQCLGRLMHRTSV